MPDISSDPVAIGSDITEQKRAEAERERLLREVNVQHGWLRAVMEALPVGMWIVDATGKMVEESFPCAFREGRVTSKG